MCIRDRLLDMQGTGGLWAGTAWNRGWDSTMHVLMLLRDLLLRRPDQVSHHLPADLGVGIEQPRRHRSVRRRPSAFSWLDDHPRVLVLPQCETTAGPCPSDAPVQHRHRSPATQRRASAYGSALAASLAPSSGPTGRCGRRCARGGGLHGRSAGRTPRSCARAGCAGRWGLGWVVC